MWRQVYNGAMGRVGVKVANGTNEEVCIGTMPVFWWQTCFDEVGKRPLAKMVLVEPMAGVAVFLVLVLSLVVGPVML